MIHRATENTVNTDKNKYFRMIGFLTLPIFGLDLKKFDFYAGIHSQTRNLSFHDFRFGSN